MIPCDMESPNVIIKLLVSTFSLHIYYRVMALSQHTLNFYHNFLIKLFRKICKMFVKKRHSNNSGICCRSLLCDIVRIKMKSFDLMKTKTQSADEFLKQFLDKDIKPLWPKGWMQTRQGCRPMLYIAGVTLTSD